MVATRSRAAAAEPANGLGTADARQAETMPPGSGMIPIARQNELASFYDRVSDPLTAVEKLGEFFHKSNMFGCDRPGQGQVLALACFCERKNPIELAAKYHLIEGKLSAKAEWMRAEFRRRGGRYKVLEATDAACRIEWHWEGETIVETFTIDEARQAGLIKDKGGWKKNPSDMLFARCTSRFMRRYAPEITGGAYTPEEIEDMGGEAAAVNGEAAVEERRRRLAEESVDVPFAHGPATINGEVVDAEFTVTKPAPAAADDPTAPPPRATTEQHKRLSELGKAQGKTGAQVGETICALYLLKKPSELNAEQAAELIEAWERLPRNAADPGEAPASDEQHAEIVRLGRECSLAGPQIKAGIIKKFNLIDPGPGKRPLITSAQADEMIADFRRVIDDAKKRAAATTN